MHAYTGIYVFPANVNNLENGRKRIKFLEVIASTAPFVHRTIKAIFYVKKIALPLALRAS